MVVESGGLNGSTPFSFDVAIDDAPGGSGRAFRIGGLNRTADAQIRQEFVLRERTHNAYLDMFEKIASTFGTRVPRNRQSRPEPSFRAPYQPLLTKNLSPEVLHGYGDPAIIRIDAEVPGEAPLFYLVATSNDAPDSFPIARSKDLREWTMVGFVFPRGHKPGWSADGEHVSDYWAPEMHRVGNEYRVYFVARERTDHGLSIGFATSPRPEGPFSTSGGPILRGDVIDPHLVVEESGDAILFWKEDANGVWPSRLNALLHDHHHLIAELFSTQEDRRTASLIAELWPWLSTVEPMERFFVQQLLMEAVTAQFTGFQQRLAKLAEGNADVREAVESVLAVMRTPIRAQRLTPDGRGFIGAPVTVLQNDLEWEAHLIEGIWVTRFAGRYYLFYAGNDFSTADYGIGVAIGDSPFGPYRKMEEPFLRSTAEWWGPGHPSVAIGPDGEPWLFLHAFLPGRTGYNEFRALLTVPIALDTDRVRIRDIVP